MKAEKWIKKDRDWSEYPIGTQAKASMGGYWTKTKRGWRWCTGSTFPTPRGDALGLIQLPIINKK